ncbi:acetyl-CoA carboxylase carboxyl transferase subunit beta, partial [Candidatus Marinamargulisbacteria bacterium SCGC AG-414-C22]
CYECGYYFQLKPKHIIELFCDNNSFKEINQHIIPTDFLNFKDKISYTNRIKKSQDVTKCFSAMVTGTAMIGRTKVAIGILNFSFIGGSLSSVEGEKFLRLCKLADKHTLPLIMFTSSGGCRMQEGVVALMQMPKTIFGLQLLKKASLPYVSVLMNPTTGGTAASFASLGDINIIEPNCLVGFSGPRVIKQTIGEDLPEDFQNSQFTFKHGLVDLIIERPQLKRTIQKILRILIPGKRLKNRTPQLVQTTKKVSFSNKPISIKNQINFSRHLNRIDSLTLAKLVCDDFLELHGDRYFSDDPAIVCGIGAIHKRRVVIIGHQKGHNTKENLHCNFGMAHPEGYYKAQRFMKMAESLQLPLITFVNTPGAFPGKSSEERGQFYAISDTIRLMSHLKIPVITFIIGEGGSGGAIALAVANKLYMLTYSFLSVISPEGCASILFKDNKKYLKAGKLLKITPQDQLKLGIIDGIIKEPSNNINASWDYVASKIRACILKEINQLSTLTPAQIIQHRFNKFQNIGIFDTL